MFYHLNNDNIMIIDDLDKLEEQHKTNDDDQGDSSF